MKGDMFYRNRPHMGNWKKQHQCEQCGKTFSHKSYLRDTCAFILGRSHIHVDNVESHFHNSHT